MHIQKNKLLNITKILLLFLCIGNSFLCTGNTVVKRKDAEKLNQKRSAEKETFSIPNSFLNKSIQVINKITGYPNKLYHYGSASMDVDYSVVVRFELENDNYLRLIQEQYQVKSSKQDIIESSVRQNHFDPIIGRTPIILKDKDQIKIDLKFFKEYIALFSPVSKRAQKKYKLHLVKENSILINDCYLSKNSIQLSRTLNYIGEKKPKGHYSNNISVEQLLVFRLLPEIPMKRRKWDPRMGNFYLSTTKYGSTDPFIREEVFLEKWKLEPIDTAAYFRGELCSPKTPIVFYMDENVPYKWKDYIKKGVLSWLPVFEKIGFKNAIEVHDKPANASWSDNDPNYNMIRWVSSEIKDAQGNYVSDPRTGEILSGTLTWYQNFFSSINDEYFVSCAATDPTAQQAVLPDSLFGKIMQATMAHEMGHALGLGHNMIASSSFPSDSLRSESFVSKHSLSPSIMDYANFNFVAQPEDMPLPLIRDIGIYDYWAIEYAYKYLPSSQVQSDMQAPYSNSEICEKLRDPQLQYMEQEYSGIIDPTNITGDLGNDPIKSAEYGLRNLKRIMPHIAEWSIPENGDPEILLSRYKKLIQQLDVLFKSVLVQIGGEVSRYKDNAFTIEKTPSIYNPEYLDFLKENLFTNTKWLYHAEIEKQSKGKYLKSIEQLQKYAIARLLYSDRLSRMLKYDLTHESTHTIDFLKHLSQIILKESSREEVPLAVQEYYVQTIEKLIQKNKDELILKHLLKNEYDSMCKLIKAKSETTKDIFLKALYTELTK